MSKFKFNNVSTYYSKILKKLRFSSIQSSDIHATSKVESGCNVYSTKMDSYSFCGYDCELYYADIGSFVSIANGVIVGGGTHPVEWVGMSPVFYEGRDSVKKKFSEYPRPPVERTIISSDVWIGRNALIKSGIEIGVGSVVGMGSVVTKNIPPYEIWAGNPAKKIKLRFSEQLCSQLLESEWWKLEDKVLEQIAVEIRDPYAFLTALEKL